jgi:hypothetical protein
MVGSQGSQNLVIFIKFSGFAEFYLSDFEWFLVDYGLIFGWFWVIFGWFLVDFGWFEGFTGSTKSSIETLKSSNHHQKTRLSPLISAHPHIVPERYFPPKTAQFKNQRCHFKAPYAHFFR